MLPREEEKGRSHLKFGHEKVCVKTQPRRAEHLEENLKE